MSKKMTRKAMLTSVVALVICFAMLVGATYAWFTDSVSSVGNKIKAGTLDIDLYQFDGNDWVEITDQSAPIFGSDQSAVAQNVNTDTLWEPGKTQVAYLKLVNNGNLWLKYSVAVDVKNVANDLYEAMRYEIIPDAQPTAVAAWDAAAGVAVTTGKQATAAVDVPMPPEAEHYFALALHMQEDAGNEYQAGEVDFDLRVLATQYTAELDSFGDQYDADAEYPDVLHVSTLADLLAAIADTSINTVVLDEDLTVDGSIHIPAGISKTINGAGKTITFNAANASGGTAALFVGEGANAFKDATLTVKNLTISDSSAAYSKAVTTNSGSTKSNITFENCTFDNLWSAAYLNPGSGSLTIKNCTYNDNVGGGLWSSDGSAYTVTITGCEYKPATMEIMSKGTITITGNDFSNVTEIAVWDGTNTVDLSANTWGTDPVTLVAGSTGNFTK